MALLRAALPALLLLLATAPALATGIVHVSQERSVFASVEASSAGGFDSDFDEIGAPPGTDFFDETIDLSASVPGVSGDFFADSYVDTKTPAAVAAGASLLALIAVGVVRSRRRRSA